MFLSSHNWGPVIERVKISRTRPRVQKSLGIFLWHPRIRTYTYGVAQTGVKVNQSLSHKKTRMRRKERTTAQWAAVKGMWRLYCGGGIGCGIKNGEEEAYRDVSSMNWASRIKYAARSQKIFFTLYTLAATLPLFRTEFWSSVRPIQLLKIATEPWNLVLFPFSPHPPAFPGTFLIPPPPPTPSSSFSRGWSVNPHSLPLHFRKHFAFSFQLYGQEVLMPPMLFFNLFVQCCFHALHGEIIEPKLFFSSICIFLFLFLPPRPLLFFPF